jgi:hypothetical protein
MNKFILIFTLVLCVTSCSHVDSRTAKNVNLSQFKHPYVVHTLNDGRGIDKIISQQLIKLGYDASHGPITMLPKSADCVIRYQDRWTFDFTTYMIQLDLQVYTARPQRLVAEDSYFRPSVTGGSEVDMVDVVLKRIFAPHNPPVPLTPQVEEPTL